MNILKNGTNSYPEIYSIVCNLNFIIMEKSVIHQIQSGVVSYARVRCLMSVYKAKITYGQNYPGNYQNYNQFVRFSHYRRHMRTEAKGGSLLSSHGHSKHMFIDWNGHSCLNLYLPLSPPFAFFLLLSWIIEFE